MIFVISSPRVECNISQHSSSSSDFHSDIRPLPEVVNWLVGVSLADLFVS